MALLRQCLQELRARTEELENAASRDPRGRHPVLALAPQVKPQARSSILKFSHPRALRALLSQSGFKP